VGADIGEPGLDVGDAMGIAGVLGLGEECGALVVGRQNDVDQPLGSVGRLLQQAADAGAGRQRHAAVLGGDLARNGTEQGRLAGAVAADEPDPRTVRDGDGGFLDQKPAGNPNG